METAHVKEHVVDDLPVVDDHVVVPEEAYDEADVQPEEAQVQLEEAEMQSEEADVQSEEADVQLEEVHEEVQVTETVQKEEEAELV